MDSLLVEYRNLFLVESTISSDIDIIKERIRSKFYAIDNLEDILDEIEIFIINSNCKSIRIAPLKALGMALHSGVVLNPSVFNGSLIQLLYVIFHEIAHQYQYKKYGDDMLFKMFKEDLPVEEGGKLMKKLEYVADEFAIRKIQQFMHKRLIPPGKLPSKVYLSVSPSYFTGFVKRIKDELIANGITDKDSFARYFYDKFQISTHT